ncbi:hypothetical protein BC835DRAFT_1307684 [Cytidiella melzeri]|nr:hypothetical protein BC835DRAFT_1307684 [Cytidiella melzeri]
MSVGFLVGHRKTQSPLINSPTRNKGDPWDSWHAPAVTRVVDAVHSLSPSFFSHFANAFDGEKLLSLFLLSATLASWVPRADTRQAAYCYGPVEVDRDRSRAAVSPLTPRHCEEMSYQNVGRVYQRRGYRHITKLGMDGNPFNPSELSVKARIRNLITFSLLHQYDESIDRVNPSLWRTGLVPVYHACVKFLAQAQPRLSV